MMTHMVDTTTRYLDLMELCLTGLLYEDNLDRIVALPNGTQLTLREARTEGMDRPGVGQTMIGLKRMANLRFCVEDVLKRNVPGDLVETGVWKGCATIFMRAILAAYNVTDRRVWLADSFEGLPPIDGEHFPADKEFRLRQLSDFCVDLDTVIANFKRYNLLDEQVQFLKGWFRDTLPTAPIDRIAVLRLDGDMYESTMDALGNLYDKVSPGGYVLVDDYGALPTCRQAVDDFRAAHAVQDEIRPVDTTGVYWLVSRRSQN